MDINYELYKVFYHVATTLSFSEAANKLFEFIEQLWKKKNSNLAICEDNYQHFRHALEQKLDSSDKQILQDLIDVRDEIEKQKYLAILILGLKLANG